jgi:Tol biopolymer transport system component
MQLERGVRLGSYEIVAPIGAGGMGEVYRARDVKLDRDVAIKILHELLGGDADRLRRFEREAKMLAALNHPNIAHIHGVIDVPGQFQGGGAGLVMEFVAGEDLAQRLSRGPLPLDEAIQIATQIADALEEAHDRGIIHRDLKPANIKLAAGGRVKVLDFGLAKALEEPVDTGPNPALSPTMTVQGTRAGVILGTAAYMSPEQARGKAVDRRADIWAFGVVLYEMLTGRPLFAGDSITDTLASVLRNEPDLSTLPADTPPAIQRLVQRCLDRDVRTRLQSMGEARIILSAASAAPSAAAAPVPAPDARRSMRLSAAVILPWTLAAAATAAAMWLGADGRRQGSAAREMLSVDLSFPPEIEPVPTVEAGFNISPDGRQVVITGVREGSRRLHVRHLSREASLEIGDSMGVTGSAFSPDSRSIAFLGSSGILSRVSLADQQRVPLARGADLAGGIAWGDPGVVFSRNGALWLVPADGGPERQITTLDAARREIAHANPVSLPGGRFVVFSSLTPEAGSERIDAVSVNGGERRVVLERAGTPLWSPTGHLLFARDGALMATPFDLDTLKTVGVAATIIPAGAVGRTSAGGLGVRLSQRGDLLYLPSNYQTKRVEVVARDGSSRRLAFPPARYLNPRMSPDGRRLMVEVGGLRLDALDVERGTVSRLTPEAPGINFTMWNKDGRHVIYRRGNAPYWTAADGSGQQGSVPSGISNDYPSGAGPGPDSFFSTRIGPDAAGDIVLLSRNKPDAPTVVVKTPAYEGGAQLSPDGRWLVYVSSESGQTEIRVGHYPAMDRKWQVSAGFGVQPRWRADGREIFFRDGQHMIAVPFDATGGDPRIGKPAALFRDEYDLGQGITIANYDVTRDGSFVLLRRDAGGKGLRLVLNWTDELQRIIAQGGVR